MQGHQVVGNLRKIVGPGTRQQAVSLSQPSASFLGRYSQAHAYGQDAAVMALSDGHAIKLTTSRYFTPSGASIHERGIKPDVVIEDAKDGDDRALHAALDLLRNPGTIRQSSAN